MRSVASNLARRGQLGQFGLGIRSSYICRQCRGIQISPAPTVESPLTSSRERDPFGSPIDPSRDTSGMGIDMLFMLRMA
jgi:hypothetical protein